MKNYQELKSAVNALNRSFQVMNTLKNSEILQNQQKLDTMIVQNANDQISILNEMRKMEAEKVKLMLNPPKPNIAQVEYKAWEEGHRSGIKTGTKKGLFFGALGVFTLWALVESEKKKK